MKAAEPRYLPLTLILICCNTVFGLTVNADFGRDVVSGTNPGTNPAAVLYSGTGPAADPGTLWNDLQVGLAANGDAGADTIVHPIQFNDLIASDGTPTAIDIRLESGFDSSFNGAAALGGSVAALQNDRIFSSGGTLAILKIQGLDPSKQYGIYLIGSGGFSTAYTVNSTSVVATGNSYDGTWTAGGEYAAFNAITPTAGGEISVGIQDGLAPIDGYGILSGLQIVERPSQLLYASSAMSTGGQFNLSYSPANLMNNKFTSAMNTINTTADYLSANNNFASLSGTIQNFNLIFDFTTPTDVTGIHIWNYIFRNGSNGANSGTSGVNSYSLAFYTGVGGTGTVIGNTYLGSLAQARFNAQNPAQSVFFDSTYSAVRSIVMRVISNHGSSDYTGMNEVAFAGSSTAAAGIGSFTVSTPFSQRPALATLNWTVTGTVTSLSIFPAIGDVLPMTSGGHGSIPVSPIGEQTYTLTLNGSIQKTVSVIGLPTKEKVHLYLLIGQSNMQGAGESYDATLDAAEPRVIKFGSRDLMEKSFAKGTHNLTEFGTTNANIGMGLAFGKALLATESDPEVVVVLINHALGSTAIQWWAPNVVHSKKTNPITGLSYYLYDEAIQRVKDASDYGVIKGVLWHQGEYNMQTNTNPDPEPNLYGSRLQALVDNLRTSFSKPGLPFICAKCVPAYPFNATNRASVEGALGDIAQNRANAFCASNEGLLARADQAIHFNSASQRILGQRYAAGMVSMYADPFRLYLGGFYSPNQLLNAELLNPAGDNDQDGYCNFLEYAFLTDPSKPQALIPVSGTQVTLPGQGNFPAITFRQRLDSEAPNYTIEISENLVDWKSNQNGLPDVTAALPPASSNDDGTITTTVRGLQSGGRHFLRVRVTGK